MQRVPSTSQFSHIPSWSQGPAPVLATGNSTIKPESNVISSSQLPPQPVTDITRNVSSTIIHDSTSNQRAEPVKPPVQWVDIDSTTRIPEDLFESLMRAGDRVREGGQHVKRQFHGEDRKLVLTESLRLRSSQASRGAKEEGRKNVYLYRQFRV